MGQGAGAMPGRAAAATQAPPLRGRTLSLARALWVAVAIGVIGLNVLVFPAVYSQPLPADTLRDLHRLGIPLAVYLPFLLLINLGYTLVYVAMGILVYWRRPDDRMAYICSLMLLMFGGIATSALDDVVLGSPMPQPVASIPILRAVVHVLVAAGQSSFIIFFYLFPSGRFVPRWTRWCAVLVAMYWLLAIFLPAGLDLGGWPIVATFLSAAAVQFYRYWRVSTPTQREQTKWVVLGVIGMVLIVMVPQLILTLLQATLPRDIVATANRSPVIQSLIGSRWNIALALVPICLAIAITRSGLWAIETLINRALVYGSLTATISAIYLACVGGAQLAAQAITGRTGLPEVALVVTTLLVAALFTPLRRRLQAAVDRRFYRRKYDAARTLAAFSATLRTETDLRQLREQLVRVVDETMQPASVSLWLRSPHARRQEVRP